MLDKNLHELLKSRRGKPLSLQEIQGVTQQLFPEKNVKERIMFITLLRMMLHFNPQESITPSKALNHPFLTLSELDDDDTSSKGSRYVVFGYCFGYLVPWQLAISSEVYYLMSDGYKAATGIPPQNHSGSSTRFSSLSDLLRLFPEKNVKERIMFITLLRMMLHFNPQESITPSKALNHPFLTPSELDDDDTSSNGMSSSTPMSIFSGMESVETSNEDLVDDGYSAAVDTAHVTSAATESSSRDSVSSCSGVENIPAVCSNDGASDGAVVSADVHTSSSDDASIAPMMTGLNDTVSDHNEASENAAGLADDSASADEAESNDAGPREEDSAPSCSRDERLSAFYINGGYSDSGGSYDQVIDDAVSSANDDEAAVTPASTESSTALATADLCDAVSANKHTVISDGVSATDSRNTQRKLLKRIRRFFRRVFRVLHCSWSVDVVE
ncbi:uncharacterized protein LOC127379455 [Dicentrarchus labrax]|uniref:uncharacterized protein LOC127379455 n=1 Tax=Dicentrarchus labrax TaxID=13489 RepID=UPI0021F56480|nr:uncharacterized protein LOC127379455 [Dicentrarchus labrax]